MRLVQFSLLVRCSFSVQLTFMHQFSSSRQRKMISKRYRVNALSFSITRKNIQLLLGLLVLIIIWQRMSYSSNGNIPSPKKREIWPFMTPQTYRDRFMAEYSPAKAFVTPEPGLPGEDGSYIFEFEKFSVHLLANFI